MNEFRVKTAQTKNIFYKIAKIEFEDIKRLFLGDFWVSVMNIFLKSRSIGNI